MLAIQAINPRQIKAARALLDWSQEDLASASQLSVATIRKLELGFISPRLSTTHTIRHAIENAGLEFIDYEGVRRRPEEMAIYQGAKGMAAFLEDVAHTMRRKSGGEGIVLTVADTMFAGGAWELVEELEQLANAHDIKIKCLLVDAPNFAPSSPRIECHALSKGYIDPITFWVYGDKYAVIAADRTAPLKIAVIQSSPIAQASRRHFLSMWEKGMGVRQQLVSA